MPGRTGRRAMTASRTARQIGGDADFLRRRLSRKSVEADFDKAIEKALALAKSKDAVYLPGWCGPTSDD